MSNFKAGDIVITTNAVDGVGIAGMIGTVDCVTRENRLNVEVFFRKEFGDYISTNGWWCEEENLEPYNPSPAETFWQKVKRS